MKWRLPARSAWCSVERMNEIRIASLVIVVVTATFAGVQLARKPPDVVQVTHTSHCRTLGTLSAVSLVIDTSRIGLRRKVAALGGNAYRVISENGDPLSDSVKIQAEALDCR